MKKQKRKLITSLAATGIVSAGFAVSSFVVPDVIDKTASSHPPSPHNYRTDAITTMKSPGSSASLFSRAALQAKMDILIEQDVYSGKLKKETYLIEGSGSREYERYFWFDDRVDSEAMPSWKEIEISPAELESYTMEGWGVKNPDNIHFGDPGFSHGGLDWNFWYGVFEYSPVYAYVDNKGARDAEGTFKIILEAEGITVDLVAEPPAIWGSTQDELNRYKNEYPSLISKEAGEWKYQELIGKGRTERINKKSFEGSFYKELENTSSFRFSDDIYSYRAGQMLLWNNPDGPSPLESIFLSQKS